MDEIKTPKAPRFDVGCRACRLAEGMEIGKAGDRCEWHAGYFSSVAEIERKDAALVFVRDLLRKIRGFRPQVFASAVKHLDAALSPTAPENVEGPHITEPDQNGEHGVWIGKTRCLVEGLTLLQAKAFVEEWNITHTPPALKERACSNCQHDGHQAFYPSGCTDCGDGELKNWKPKLAPEAKPC